MCTITLAACRAAFICWACLILAIACEDSSKPPPQSRAVQGEAKGPDGSQVVHLYFSDKENSFLIAENRHLLNQNDPASLGTQIVQALLKGPQTALEPTIPEDTALKAFYLTQNGIAFVDLSVEVMENHPGGAQQELLTIYSIVNSLILNSNEIKAVKILIDGREASTLAGHIDLRAPLKANMLLIR